MRATLGQHLSAYLEVESTYIGHRTDGAGCDANGDAFCRYASYHLNLVT